MFQFAVITYFVSMFVLRFAFPAFSSERRTAWILGAAPLDLSMVFTAKLRFFTILFSTLAVLFALLNTLLAPFSATLITALLLLLCIATLFLTTYGLSLGAIFPNFESDDPETLSTTMPGLGFIFGALLYGALGASAFGVMAKSGEYFPVFAFVALSLGGVIYLSRHAHRALARMEF
jgi:ABC-2 type transport system permease protein